MLSGVIVAPADAESDIIAAGFKILNIREGREQDNLVPGMKDFMVEGPDSALEVIDDDGRWGEWIWSLEDDDGYETMTVDEVAEMVWTRLSHRIDEIIDAGVSYRNDRFRGVKVDKYHEALIKERARAVAEALVGVRVTR